ncbi:MAG: hypothetical protein OXC11_14260 [Rhodospirillales bacterium]|nr:hypothetical protein [Rhodospirillales bacterium]
MLGPLFDGPTSGPVPQRTGRRRAFYSKRGIKLYPPRAGESRWEIVRRDGHRSTCASEAAGRHQIDGLCRHVARS